MLGKTALLYTDDRAAARTLAGHLRATATDVVMVDAASAACDLLGARVVDLVLIDGGSPDALDVVTAARGRAPAVVLSNGADSAAMLDLVCDREVEHVFARSGADGESLGDLAREVVITAEKILRRDLFGVEKYLPAFGCEVSTSEVRGADERDDVVEAIAAHAEWLGAGREARRAVAAIVDELVTNAVYDAPRDAAGRARYLHVDRRDKVRLDPWEYVTVRWGSDGDLLIVSVSDCFGALRPEHVRNGLRRCLGADDQIEQKPGGAGLGLYTALAYSSQLVINISAGSRTEVIAAIDLRRRAAGARRTGRSLHVFFDDEAARIGPTSCATPVEPVALSETFRMDLREQLAKMQRRPDLVPLVQKGKRASMHHRPRASTPPPMRDPIGADTARGLLRGAAEVDTAIAVALRFLEHHYEAAVAYQVDGDRVRASQAGGGVRDWVRLRELDLEREDDASLAVIADRGVIAAFRPDRPIDHRIAMLAVGQSDADGLVVPLRSAGDLRWVLYAAQPLDGAAPAAAEIERVQRELEACLDRLDPDEPTIEVRN
jgi:hypothetical protein